MEESAVEPVSVMSVPVQDGTQVVEEMVEEMQMLPQTRLLSSAEGGVQLVGMSDQGIQLVEGGVQMVEGLPEGMHMTEGVIREDGTIELQTESDVVEVQQAVVSELILLQDTWTNGMMSKLHDMCTTGMFCDMALVSTDGERVLCHSSVMVAASTYFNKLLSALNQTFVNAQMSVHLSLDAALIKQVLSFVYTGKVSVSTVQLPSLTHAASFFDIPVLKQLCENAEQGVSGGTEGSEETQGVRQTTQHHEEMAVEVQDDGKEVGHTIHIVESHDGDEENATIMEGELEIEGAVDSLPADTAEVISVIANQQPLSISPGVAAHSSVQAQQRQQKTDISEWDKVFICQYCNRTFRRKDLLQSHERVHTGDRPFHCQYCPKAFKQKPHLIEHTRQHTGVKPYHCTVCDMRFAYYSHYNKHKHLHAEGGRKTYVCQYCQKVFLSFPSFQAHEREHRGEKPFLCNVCDEGFTLRSKLVEHQRIQHGLNWALQCQYCTKRFSNNSHLKEHERTHTGERPFACTICTKAFKTKSTLVKHQETHWKDGPFKCAECGKRYARESLLQEHQRTHTGERPYECTFCNVRFSRQSTLCNHLKIHTTGRQYRCEVCNAAFVRKDDCIKHLVRRHPTGELFPFSCDVCHKNYPTNAKMLMHKRRKHGKAALGTEKENAVADVKESQSDASSDEEEGELVEGQTQEFIISEVVADDDEGATTATGEAGSSQATHTIVISPVVGGGNTGEGEPETGAEDLIRQIQVKIEELEEGQEEESQEEV